MRPWYAIRILAPAGVVLLSAGVADAAPVYKYEDEAGEVTYSDVPPPNEDAETVRLQSDLPPGRQESAQERVQRMQEMSSELEESRRDREDTRTERRTEQRTSQPQTVWPGDRTSDRYPDRYFPQRPPVGVSPPVAVPPIELPEGPGGGVGDGSILDHLIVAPAR